MIICTVCGTENPDKAKFCSGCGNRFSLRCPQCGFENRAGSVFCNECGTRIGEPARPPASSPQPVPSVPPVAFSPPVVEPPRQPVIVNGEQAPLDLPPWLQSLTQNVTAKNQESAAPLTPPVQNLPSPADQPEVAPGESGIELPPWLRVFGTPPPAAPPAVLPVAPNLPDEGSFFDYEPEFSQEPLSPYPPIEAKPEAAQSFPTNPPGEYLNSPFSPFEMVGEEPPVTPFSPFETVGEIPSTRVGEENTPVLPGPDAGEANMPSWLAEATSVESLSPFLTSEQSHGPVPPAPEPPVDENIPPWIREMSEKTPPPPSAPVRETAPSNDESEPDWLRNVGDQFARPVNQEPDVLWPTSPGLSTAPDSPLANWLSQQDQQQGSPLQHRGKGDIVAPLPDNYNRPVGTTELPSWLQDPERTRAEAAARGPEIPQEPESAGMGIGGADLLPFNADAFSDPLKNSSNDSFLQGNNISPFFTPDESSTASPSGSSQWWDDEPTPPQITDAPPVSAPPPPFDFPAFDLSETTDFSPVSETTDFSPVEESPLNNLSPESTEESPSFADSGLADQTPAPAGDALPGLPDQQNWPSWLREANEGSSDETDIGDLFGLPPRDNISPVEFPAETGQENVPAGETAPPSPDASPLDLPPWLMGTQPLRLEPEISNTTTAEGAPVLEDILPDWLMSNEPVNDTPVSAPTDEFSGFFADQGLPETSSPLSGFFADQPASAANVAGVGSSDLPAPSDSFADFLGGQNSFNSPPSKPKEQHGGRSNTDFLEETDLPDWLRILQPEQSQTLPPLETTSEEESIAEVDPTTQVIPAWLRNLSPSTEEETAEERTEAFPLPVEEDTSTRFPLLPHDQIVILPPRPGAVDTMNAVIDDLFGINTTVPAIVRPAPPLWQREVFWSKISALALVAAIVIGLLFPTILGDHVVPHPSDEVKTFYNQIDDSVAANGTLPATPKSPNTCRVQPGDPVLVAFDWEASTMAEMKPISQAIIYHLAFCGAKIMTVSSAPQGVIYARQIVDAILGNDVTNYRNSGQESVQFTEGVDYKHLGLVPGNEIGLRTINQKLPSGAEKAKFAPTLNSFHDIKLVVVLADSEQRVRGWYEQVKSVNPDVRMILGVPTSLQPVAESYYRPDESVSPNGFNGVLIGTLAETSYQQLLLDPPSEPYKPYNSTYYRKTDLPLPSSRLSAMTVALYLIVIILVLSNVVYVLRRRR